MAKTSGKPLTLSARKGEGLAALTVKGFKSLVDETTVELRPLTLLAGANSTGKSSLMQPLLLLKQTLESSFDPGPLLLDGPNVSFYSADDFLSKMGTRRSASGFSVGYRTTSNSSFMAGFRRKSSTEGLELDFNRHMSRRAEIRLDSSTSRQTIDDFLQDTRPSSDLSTSPRKRGNSL